MPTFHVDADTVGGSWSNYQTFAFRQRCACCRKHKVLSWWIVSEERTRFSNGTQTIYRELFCSPVCERKGSGNGQDKPLPTL